MINPYKASIVIVIALAVVAGGYYELAVRDNIGNQLIPEQSGGTLNLYVFDSPLENLSAVYITFTSISLYNNLNGWQNFSLGKDTVNVLHLSASNASLLKGIHISPQNYSAVDLYITSVLVNTGVSNETFSLSSHQAFFSHGFSVVKNKTTNVNIEFDLSSDLNFETKTFSPNGASSYTTGALGSKNRGTLNMYVYDAPAQKVSAVYLTFSNISLDGVQTGWNNYSVANRTIDILNMSQTNASLLGGINLGPQNYTMIRLYIQNVTVTVNGVNESFRMASPFAFINKPFSVSSNLTTDMYVQFDLASDLNMHSKMLTPHVGTIIKA